MAFKADINAQGIFPVITLKDESNNCEAEVYAFGALLNSFSIITAAGNTNVIDGFASPKDAIENITNVVKEVYKPFTTDQLSKKIAELLTPEGTVAEVSIVYQTIEGLHAACPNNTGDWYFTGNYPTPGGNQVVNKAFINYYEGKNVRGY